MSNLEPLAERMPEYGPDAIAQMYHEDLAELAITVARQIAADLVATHERLDEEGELRAEAKRLSLDLSGVKSNHPKD